MSEKELFITIVSTILLFAVTTAVIILFVVRYIRKSYLHKQELLNTKMEVQEQTRKNLASDLHDNIGQILSLTNVMLGSINLQDTGKAAQKIKDSQELVIRSIKELRQLSRIIQGEQMIKEGLAASIQQEINWIQRNGFYSVSFITPDESPSANPEKDLFLFRLLQESLNNIIKHSGANTISIELAYPAEAIVLRISDNGVGFDAEEKIKTGKGLGLQHMQARTDLLNGSMAIESNNGKGTAISFTIPYPHDKQ